MNYDLVLRSRRAVLPEGTQPAAIAVSGSAIAAVAGYGEPLDAASDGEASTRDHFFAADRNPP